MVEVRLEDRVEVLQRVGEGTAGFLARLIGPAAARRRDRLNGSGHELVLVVHVSDEVRLLRHAVDEPPEEQLVLPRVVVVQHVDRERDVVGEELHPLRRRGRVAPDELRALTEPIAERLMDDGHVSYVDRLRRAHPAVPPVPSPLLGCMTVLGGSERIRTKVSSRL